MNEEDDWSEWNPTLLKKDRSPLLKISGNMQSSTSSSKKPTERERLDKVVLQSRHRKSYQNRGGNKTPEKSAALIQAKLEYLEILKKEALEKAAMEKEILQNTLIEQELKIKLLRRQLEDPTFV